MWPVSRVLPCGPQSHERRRPSLLSPRHRGGEANVRNFEFIHVSCHGCDACHCAFVSDCREVHQHVTRIGRDGLQRPMCENSHRQRLALPPCRPAPWPAGTPPRRPALACRVALPNRSLTRPPGPYPATQHHPSRRPACLAAERPGSEPADCGGVGFLRGVHHAGLMRPRLFARCSPGKGSRIGLGTAWAGALEVTAPCPSSPSPTARRARSRRFGWSGCRCGLRRCCWRL
jgi:hypothetical protein